MRNFVRVVFSTSLLFFIFSCSQEENIPVFELKISSKPVEGGTVSSSHQTNTIKQGEELTLRAVPNDGYYFLYWKGDYSSTDSILNFKFLHESEVVAHFYKTPSLHLDLIETSQSYVTVNLDLLVDPEMPIQKMGYYVSKSEDEDNKTFYKTFENQTEITVSGLELNTSYKVQFMIENQQLTTFSNSLEVKTLGNEPLQIGNDSDWINIIDKFVQKKDGSLYSFEQNGLNLISEENWISFSPHTYFILDSNLENLPLFGVKADGTLWQILPELRRIGSEADWSKVITGEEWSTNFIWAIKKNGTLWTWAEQGDPKIYSQNYPTIEENDWLDGSLGGLEGTHLLLIHADGSIWGLGTNQVGQLGIGTDRNYDELVKSLFPNKAKFLVAGGFLPHSLAIDQNGKMWRWGGRMNNNGFSELEPNLVENHSDWIFALPGNGISYGIKKDGTLWYWGRKRDDSDWSSQIIETPTIANEDKWIIISEKLGIKQNGTLWKWSNYPYYY